MFIRGQKALHDKDNCVAYFSDMSSTSPLLAELVECSVLRVDNSKLMLPTLEIGNKRVDRATEVELGVPVRG